MNARGTALLVVAIALSAAVVIALPAGHTQGPTGSRAITARFVDGIARLDADGIVDVELAHRLESGLPETLATRAHAYRDDVTAPLATAERECLIVHDPWLRNYRVRVHLGAARGTGPHSPQPVDAASDRTHTVDSLADVIDRCVALHDFPVGSAREWSRVRGDDVSFAVVHELNPVSADTVHRIRRWLLDPDGTPGGDEAFFGSFVGLFVNRRIGEAERTIESRSSATVRVP